MGGSPILDWGPEDDEVLSFVFAPAVDRADLPESPGKLGVLL